MKKILIFIILLLILIALSYSIYKIIQKNQTNDPDNTQTSTTSIPSKSSPETPSSNFVFPITQFKERITKKPFSIHVTPQNSPVQPERFTGYHTGTDVEYQDITTDVPVYAIADGEIIYSNFVSGYGGVLILKINISDSVHSILYGHLRPSSLPNIGKTFKKGEQIAVLGTNYSYETDSERRHLHLSVLFDDRIDLKGYVQNQSELSRWIDPLTLYE